MDGPPASLLNDPYFIHHHIHTYIQDAISLILQGDVDDPSKFLADYFTSITTGQHIVGREFAYISCTPYNRATFLRVAKAALASIVNEAAPLTQADVVSCLQLLCSNFSSSAVRNTWSSALAMYCDAARTPQERDARRAAGCVPLATVLHCLEVTFQYERCLMALRVRCFNSSKACNRFHEITSDISAVEQEMGGQGWPSPPGDIVRAAVWQASLDGANPAFSFADLVRSLCRNPQLRAELKAADEAADARAAEVRQLQSEYMLGGELDEEGGAWEGSGTGGTAAAAAAAAGVNLDCEGGGLAERPSRSKAPSGKATFRV